MFDCALRGEDGSLAVLRSGESSRHDPLYDICNIQEAARATSAASTLSPPVEIGFSQSFIDGALTRSNNSIWTADFESNDLWPIADRMIISVG